MKPQRDLWLRLLALGVVGVAALTALLGAHWRFTRQHPGGTDFLVPWVATRRFLFQGESPYSEATTLEIQERIYGRPAYAWEHQQRPVYPFPFVFLYAPFALIADFSLARALWMVVVEAALLSGVWVWLRLIPWRPKPFALAALFLYTLLGYFPLRALINGNFVALQTALFMWGAFALARGRDSEAGILLALTTIKPHLALLPLTVVLLWSASQRRWRVWRSLALTLAVLLGAATWLQPDWWIQDLRLILAYPGYNPPGSPQAVLRLWLPGLGPLLAWVLTLAVWGLLLFEGLALWGKPVTHFVWTFAFTLLASQWSGLQTDPGNLVLALPGLVLAWGYWCTRWAYGRVAFVLTWVALLVGNWWLFLKTLRWVGGQPLQSPVMYFPLPIVAFFMLYSVRFWATRRRWLHEQDTLPLR